MSNAGAQRILEVGPRGSSPSRAPSGHGRASSQEGATQDRPAQNAAHPSDPLRIRAKKALILKGEPALDPISKRLGFVHGQFFEGQPQGPTHLRGLLMDVANQGWNSLRRSGSCLRGMPLSAM